MNWMAWRQRRIKERVEDDETRTDLQLALAEHAEHERRIAEDRREQDFRIALDRYGLAAERASIWYPMDETHLDRVRKRSVKRQEVIDLYRKAVQDDR